VKKETKKVVKKEKYKIMSLDEIEEVFAKKTEHYNEVMKKHQESQIRPITMKLIIKYAVADYSNTEKFIEDSQRDEGPESWSSKLSRMIESQDGDETKASSTVQEESKASTIEESKISQGEIDDEEKNEEDDNQYSSGPEDSEAYMVYEKKKIDKVFEEAQ
jgi:hypothetical protein